MTLRWIEGFEGVSTVAEGHGRLYNSAPDNNFVAEDGASVDADEAVSDDNNFLTTKPLVGSASNSWIFGFAFRSDNQLDIDDGFSFPYAALANSAGEQLRVEFFGDNPTNAKPGGLYYRLRIMRGVTEIARTDQAFWLGLTGSSEWCYFEFKITLDNATGSVEGRFHWMRKQSRNPSGGYTTLTWDNAVTSIDTQEQATTGADRFTLSWDSGNAADPVAFDEIYVCDSLGTKNNDFLGKVIIQQQTITTTSGGDGTTTDWTLVTASTTEDALQEPHITLEDDKRVTSDVTNQIHLAQNNPLPAEIANATIIGVRKDIHARMETTGSLSVGHMWRKTTGTPAQIESGTALVVSSTTLTGGTVIAEDDPNTGADWVNTDLDTYQFGVKNNG